MTLITNLNNYIESMLRPVLAPTHLGRPESCLFSYHRSQPWYQRCLRPLFLACSHITAVVGGAVLGMKLLRPLNLSLSALVTGTTSLFLMRRTLSSLTQRIEQRQASFQRAVAASVRATHLATGASPIPDPYASSILTYQAEHRRRVEENSQTGIPYIQSALEDHFKTLTPEQRNFLKAQIEERDADLFLKVPPLVITYLLKNQEADSRESTPHFMHPHIEKLQQLRLAHKTQDPIKIKNLTDDIATTLHRQPDFIRSMQGAFESLLNKKT